GSDDSTVEIAGRFTENVIITGKGRGNQMRCGADKSTGDILLFLHSDCILPDRAFETVRKIMSVEGIAVGAFDLGIDHSSLCFRIIELGANIRSRITRNPYGDQGMFMRRKVYEDVGGFADIPIMEDIEISHKLKNVGRVKFARPPIMTSPRRWLKEGLLYTTLRDWKLALSYSLFDAKPEELLKEYKDVR
ncbi:MAG: TIGR04283 family arsenosugar biosynthesis glycosyltransferase, partial [Thermodesulfovibrionales bacterium]